MTYSKFSRMAESLDGERAASDQRLQGSRPDSLSMGSDYHYDPFCEVCFASKNQNVKHDGFCKDCVQFLCKDCLRVHKTLQGTRGHVIQRGNDMPKSMADKPPKFDYCDAHQQSRKDQYCWQHRVLLCSKCISLQHKYCLVKSVGDACKSVPTSEIDTLYDKVSDIKANLSSVVAQIDHNITELGKQQVGSLKDAQDLKDKVIAKVDKKFQDMISEINSTYTAKISDLGRCQNGLNDVITDLQVTLDDINKQKGSTVNIKVFLKIQDILKDIKQCKSTTEKLKPSAMNVKLSFLPDKRIQEFLSTPFNMGSITLVTSQPQVPLSVPEILFPLHPATKLCSYNTQLGSDEKNCLITAMVITNDGRVLVLLADYIYPKDKIKLFSRDMKLLCSLSLLASPWDTAITGDREAIVSCLNEEKLLILDISDRRMSIKRTVKLPFVVVGIATYKDKLVVSTSLSISLSTSPASVKLIDQSGRVYWSTDTHDQQGQYLFYRPACLTCYDDGGSVAVIVSDVDDDKLTVLNADTGDIIARRKVVGKDPQGVTADTSGIIYVCYRRTGEVAVLTNDLSQERVLLSEAHGLSKYPQAIAYNSVDHQLLVSYEYNSNIDCFQLR